MIANLALLLWPLVTIVLFQRQPLAWALSAAIIGGYLLLPTQTAFDLPLVPPLNKHSIPALAALVMTIVALGRRRPVATLPMPKGWLPRHPVILPLFVGALLSGVMTVMVNSDPLIYGPLTLQGLQPYDALSAVVSLFLMLLPFLLGRRVLASTEGHRILLTALTAAGVAYALLALFEIRMSPRINIMVYGFFPHDWIQHYRGGSWRPVVFMTHGLWLGIFFCCTVLAAFGLWRTGSTTLRRRFLWAGLWLLLTLSLSSTFGALGIALVLLPAILFAPVRLQMLIAAGVTVIVLSYPTLRYSDLIPTDRILSSVERINVTRSQSLGARFKHEGMMLTKARERPLFGWGGYGRSRIYNDRGTDLSVADGRWAIIFGVGGWARYICEFGLLGAAILIMAIYRTRLNLMPVTGILTLVLAANLVDLIPNSGLSPITWLMAGALAGRLELKPAASRVPVDVVAEASPREPAYHGTSSEPTYSRGRRTRNDQPPPQDDPGRYTRFPTTPGRRK